jgi:hypothetical protein
MALSAELPFKYFVHGNFDGIGLHPEELEMAVFAAEESRMPFMIEDGRHCGQGKFYKGQVVAAGAGLPVEDIARVGLQNMTLGAMQPHVPVLIVGKYFGVPEPFVGMALKAGNVH